MKTIILWFNGLSMIKKIFVIVVAVLLILLSIQSARLARSEYLRLKSIEKEYKDAKNLVKESELKESELVEEVKVKAQKTSSKNKSINDKLKEDEKFIDNDSVSDAELFEFITKHENRSR